MQIHKDMYFLISELTTRTTTVAEYNTQHPISYLLGEDGEDDLHILWTIQAYTMTIAIVEEETTVAYMSSQWPLGEIEISILEKCFLYRLSEISERTNSNINPMWKRRSLSLKSTYLVTMNDCMYLRMF